MDKLFFKPDLVRGFKGWGKVNNVEKIETNVADRKYDYLLSLLGLNPATVVAKDGKFFLTIGKGDINLKCEDKQTAIKITEDGIAIVGLTEEAVSNGVKILIDMKKNAKSEGEYPIGEFTYQPKVDFRGVHFCIFKPNDGTEKDDTSPINLKRRFKMAALAGYNYIVLEFWGMFPYAKREYAHWPNCFSRETVLDLISFLIDDLHVTAIPHQNLTSHAGWSRIITRQHVVLDQRPDLAYMWVPGGWCFNTLCKDTKDYLKDIIEDLVTTFRYPPILHCSCDKCFCFGSTEEERVLSSDDLFVNHLKFLHDELAKYGVKMAMWADMLYSSMDVKYWKASEGTASRLPKDILMNIWTHNDIGSGEWKDISFFEDQGFKTVYSPWINREGAKNMIKQCIKHKSLGILQTTWHKPETAFPTVIYSGAYMFNGSEVSDDVINSCYLK